MPKHKKRKIKPSNHISVIKKLVGIFFILLGFVLLYIQFTPHQNGAGYTAQINTAAKEPIVADKAFEKESKGSHVRGIIITRLNIDLLVMPSKINNGYWEVSESTASHGEGSANPGENGNVVVFAHAKDGLFLNLRNIKKDDEVYILTEDKKYKYIVSEITSVYPNDITTVAPTNSEILTLFTCSGFFDEKRLIVKAIPEKPIQIEQDL